MPNASARRCTRLPTLPNPTSPRTCPPRSCPMNRAPSNADSPSVPPSIKKRWALGNPRASMIMKARAWSATDSAFLPGVLTIGMCLADAAATSTLTGPPRAQQINLRLGAAASTSSVTGAPWTIRICASRTRPAICVEVVLRRLRFGGRRAHDRDVVQALPVGIEPLLIYARALNGLQELDHDRTDMCLGPDHRELRRLAVKERVVK